MIAGTSLVSQIPMPQQSRQIKVDTPVASIKVGDVADDKNCAVKDENQSFFGKLKNRYLEYRIRKLESKPEAQRTPTEQAELEANKNSVDCMV